MLSNPKEINPRFLIDIINQEKPPSLFFTVEADGIIVKQFNFIKWHKDFYEERIELPEIPEDDVALFSSFKRELEIQLELNQQHCLKYYALIKGNVIDRLNIIFNDIYWDHLERSEKEDLHRFVLYVRYVLHHIMAGVDLQTLKAEIEDGIKGDSVMNFPNDFAIQGVYLSMGKILSDISPQVEVIEQVVNRSVDIYHKYLLVHSKIAAFDYKKVLYELKKDSSISIIGSNKSLSSAEKVQMVEEARKRPGVKSYDQALDVLGSEGNRPYENYKSFNSARHRLKI